LCDIERELLADHHESGLTNDKPTILRKGTYYLHEVERNVLHRTGNEQEPVKEVVSNKYFVFP